MTNRPVTAKVTEDRLTLCVPTDLKAAVSRAAHADLMTSSEWTRRALQEALRVAGHSCAGEAA
jgi:hypothetical protein